MIKQLLMDDITFKYVFKDQEILKDFINSFLEYVGIKEKYTLSKMEEQSILFPEHKEKKVFYSDIVAILSNGDIINIEPYKSEFNKSNFNKSYSYMCRLYSSQMKGGAKDYGKLNKVISLNLINGNYQKMNKELINDYKFCNVLTKKVIDKTLQIYLVRVDLVKTMTYNKHEKRFIKWIRLLDCQTIKELEEMAKGDKVMEQAIKQFKYWSENGIFNTFEDYVEENKVEARYEGLAEGEAEGLAEGEKNKQIEIAKTMLNKNMSIEEISDITKLSKEEVENL